MKEQNRKALIDMATVFKAMGDYNRLLIIGYLASTSGGESSVGDLCTHFQISQPAISQHLKILQNIGLVSYRKEGNFRIYTIDVARFEQIKDQFMQIYQLAFDNCSGRKNED
jgi:ArsR family transcriptional regulator